MDVFLASVARTPFCPRNGALAGWHSVDLLSAAISSVIGDDLDGVDVAIGACSSPIGENAANVTRNAMVAAGALDAAAWTNESGAAGGMIALDQAFTYVSSGRFDVVIVGAVDSSTRVPPGATSGTAVGKPYGRLVHDRFEADGGLKAPGLVAEEMAMRYGFDRALLDEYAAASYKRRLTAAPSVVALERRSDKGKSLAGVIDADIPGAQVPNEGSLPMFVENGLLTAATFRTDADGAAALLVCSQRGLERLGRSPLARLATTAVAGSDPLSGDSGHAVALSALKAAGADLAGAEVIVSEDSAVTPLALSRDLGVDVNANGGYLTVGLPTSCAGLAEVVDATVAGSGRPHLVVQAGTEWTATAAYLAPA